MTIGAPTTAADVDALCDRLREGRETGDAELVVCDVGALTAPHADTVDALARLALTARRTGARVELRNACAELRELLDLLGLAEVVPCSDELWVEPRRQPKEWEELRGVQEEGDAADAPA